jgi:hypothetical protein
MAKFKTGNPGKKKGAKNRAATRRKLADWVENNWSRFDQEMKSVKGKSFCELFIKVLPFMMPAYQSINFSLSNMPETDLEFLIEKLKEQIGNEQSEQD